MTTGMRLVDQVQEARQVCRPTTTGRRRQRARRRPAPPARRSAPRRPLPRRSVRSRRKPGKRDAGLLNDRRGGVVRAVVDDDHLAVELLAADVGLDLGQRVRQARLLVVRRDDQRQARAHAAPGLEQRVDGCVGERGGAAERPDDRPGGAASSASPASWPRSVARAAAPRQARSACARRAAPGSAGCRAACAAPGRSAGPWRAGGSGCGRCRTTPGRRRRWRCRGGRPAPAAGTQQSQPRSWARKARSTSSRYMKNASSSSPTSASIARRYAAAPPMAPKTGPGAFQAGAVRLAGAALAGRAVATEQVAGAVDRAPIGEQHFAGDRADRRAVPRSVSTHAATQSGSAWASLFSRHSTSPRAARRPALTLPAKPRLRRSAQQPHARVGAGQQSSASRRSRRRRRR